MLQVPNLSYNFLSTLARWDPVYTEELLVPFDPIFTYVPIVPCGQSRHFSFHSLFRYAPPSAPPSTSPPTQIVYSTRFSALLYDSDITLPSSSRLFHWVPTLRPYSI